MKLAKFFVPLVLLFLFTLVAHGDDKYPDLPYTLDTGDVSFRLPSKMVVAQNDSPLKKLERTIWVSEWSTKPLPVGAKLQPFVLVTRIKFSDEAWSYVNTDLNDVRKTIIGAMKGQGVEVTSSWFDSTPAATKSLETLYSKLNDPQKIFGNNSIRYATELIDPKLSPDATTGSVTNGGIIYMNDPSGKYLSGTAYIVDKQRKTQYLIQFSFPGETDFNKILPGVIRVVVSSAKSKPLR